MLLKGFLVVVGVILRMSLGDVVFLCCLNKKCVQFCLITVLDYKFFD